MRHLVVHEGPLPAAASAAPLDALASRPALEPSSPTAPQPEAKGKGQENGKEKGGQGEASQKAEKGDRGDAGGQKVGSSGGASSTAGGSARTPDEQRDALDGQLQTSMAEFDGMLLEEQKALEEKQRTDPLPDRSGESSGGAGGGGGEGGEGGGQAGESGGKDDRTAAEKRADAEAEAAAKQAKAEETGKAGEAGQAGAPTADTATGSSTDAGRLEGGTPVTAPVEGGPAGPGSDDATVPADVGDGKDDDVVARQLREAAMKEKDPAIREKLWEEYREYKKGTGKGGS